MATGIYDPTKTGNSYIDPLLSGWKWDGAPVSYGFAQSVAAYENPEQYYGQYPLKHFQPLSAMSVAAFQGLLTGQKDLAGDSMTLTPVAGFTNLTFTQADPASAQTDMRFGMSSYAPYAIGFAPGERSNESGADGDVWIGNTGGYGTAFQLQNPVNGSWGYYGHIWSLGKALGLNSGYMDIPKDKQFKEYTVMTYYNAPAVELPTADSNVSGQAGSHPEIENLSYYNGQTFMMMDIAALQQMYGANYTFRSNDSTYTWNPTTGGVYVDGVLNGVVGNGMAHSDKTNKILQTIWDGGGSDTYDLSNYTTNLKLDLRPGEYSTFSDAQRMYIGRDIDNGNWYARGNVYNALLFDDDPRSLIENAKAGLGNDSLTGNIADNQLWGNAGKDTLTGGAGNDMLNGGEGHDTAVFSGARVNYTVTKNIDGTITVADTRVDGDGTDTLSSITFAIFGDESPFALVDPAVVRKGGSGNDRLYGDIGADRLYGYGGNDRLYGLEGIDSMEGGSGNDIYYVDNRLDRVVETATGGVTDRVVTSANYTLTAHVENLTAVGTGDIRLTGNSLDNVITGNDRYNVINGGYGNDVLKKGGWGPDTFVFSSKLSATRNVDSIASFSVGYDKIHLDNAIFTKLGTGSSSSPKQLSKAFFTVGSKAKDRNDYIIYDKSKGLLSYDADGAGKVGAVEFAALTKNLKMTAGDFFVI